MNKVDIVIPVFNSAEFISYTIESVINQTEKSFKLYLVVDPCKDNSYEICKEYEEKDARIVVINNVENHGMAGSRDIGYMSGSAEWVSFLDSDDLLSPLFLEKLLKAADRETDISQAFVQTISEETRVFPPDNKTGDCYYLEGKKAFRDIFFYGKGIEGQETTWGKLIRRSCIDQFIDILREKKDIMERTYLDDFSFSPYLWYYCRKVVFCGERLYAFRMRKNSSSYDKVFNEHFLSQIFSLDERISFLSGINDTDVLYRQAINCFVIVSIYYNQAHKYCGNNIDLLRRTDLAVDDFIRNNSKYVSARTIHDIYSFATYFHVRIFCISPGLDRRVLSIFLPDRYKRKK